MDDASAYAGLPLEHEAVNHSAKEYGWGDVHTNGLEGFSSMLKLGYHGTYHKMSPKHLDRCCAEFTGHHNVSDAYTEDRMEYIAVSMEYKRLTYKALIAPNGRASGARPVGALAA